jgi:hypothetical protein
MFQMMVDENIESAICIDDDIMFHKDWVSILESINFSEIPQFINLGTFLRVEPDRVTVQCTCVATMGDVKVLSFHLNLQNFF